jgi:hypothetical protein
MPALRQLRLPVMTLVLAQGHAARDDAIAATQTALLQRPRQP